jgi:hypothetical protein
MLEQEEVYGIISLDFRHRANVGRFLNLVERVLRLLRRQRRGISRVSVIFR